MILKGQSAFVLLSPKPFPSPLESHIFILFFPLVLGGVCFQNPFILALKTGSVKRTMGDGAERWGLNPGRAGLGWAGGSWAGRGHPGLNKDLGICFSSRVARLDVSHPCALTPQDPGSSWSQPWSILMALAWSNGTSGFQSCCVDCSLRSCLFDILPPKSTELWEIS